MGSFLGILYSLICYLALYPFPWTRIFALLTFLDDIFARDVGVTIPAHISQFTHHLGWFYSKFQVLTFHIFKLFRRLEVMLVYDLMVGTQFHLFPCGHQIFQHLWMNSSIANDFSCQVWFHRWVGFPLGSVFCLIGQFVPPQHRSVLITISTVISLNRS